MWAGATSSNGQVGINAMNNLFNNNYSVYSCSATSLTCSYATGFAVITGGGTQSRWSNSIKWVSPNWSGVQVVAHYAFAGDVEKSAGKATTDSSRFGLGVKYANGPIYATATYQKLFKDKGYVSHFDTASGALQMDPAGTWSASADIDAALSGGYNGAQGYFLGGSYDFKVVKLYANYAYEKDKRAYQNAKKNTFWSLGLGVPVGKVGTVQLEYAQYKYDPKVGDEGKLKSYSLGYVHELSKRTSLYAYVSKTKNDEGLTSTYMTVPKKLSLADESVTALALGIIHKF
jgi:predicted porin